MGAALFDPANPLYSVYPAGHLMARAVSVALVAQVKAGVGEPLRTALVADALAQAEQAELSDWLATSWSASYPEHITRRAEAENRIRSLRCLVSARQQQLEARTRAAAA